MEEEMDIGNRR